ncbi:MAG: LPS export ABC transporter periplasmic protein LptC [Deltaproteobacteria bacterium]
MSTPLFKVFKYLVISLIFLVSITVAGFLYLWMGRKGASYNLPRIIPDLKIEGVHLTRALAGKMEWELKARSADFFREEGVTRLDAPKVVFFGNGDKRIELTGSKGEVFNNTNDLAVSGDVSIVSSDGYTLRSDLLRYYSEKKIIVTESKVFLKGRGIDMEGVGMVADIERDRIFVKKGVKAVLSTGEWGKR